MLLTLPEFDVIDAQSVEQAWALLARYGAEAQLFAGGTDLFVKMKHRRSLPKVLINLKRIPGLDRIRYDFNDGLRIGALATIQAIRESSVINTRFRMLGQAAGALGTAQIRNLGTLGGNLANASPSAEFGPPLLVLEAAVHCAGPNGERRIPMTDFFLAPGKSALRPDEVLTELHVSNPLPGTQALYLKHSLRRMDVAMASAAVLVRMEQGVCRDVRIALGAVAPTPFRAAKAEAALSGRKLAGDENDREVLEKVARIAAEETRPIDDLRSQADYRRKVIALLVKQALEQVVARAH